MGRSSFRMRGIQSANHASPTDQRKTVYPIRLRPFWNRPFPETRPNQKRSSETFQTTFALTSDSLGFKTARAYFLIAVRILSAMWVAPAVRPDIPISDAAASLINSFILSLFLVFVLQMLSSGRLIICRLRRCFWRRSSRWRSDRTCQSGRRLPI